MRTLVLAALACACAPLPANGDRVRSTDDTTGTVTAPDTTPPEATDATGDTTSEPTTTTPIGDTGDTGAPAPDELRALAAPLNQLDPWLDGDEAEVFFGAQGGWHVDYELVVENLDAQEVFVTPRATNLETGEVFESGRLGIALIFDPATRVGHVPTRALLIPLASPELACPRLDAAFELELEVIEIVSGRVATHTVQLVPEFRSEDGLIDCAAF